MRWVRTRVLPEPAPATMSSGPPGVGDSLGLNRVEAREQVRAGLAGSVEGCIRAASDRVSGGRRRQQRPADEGIDTRSGVRRGAVGSGGIERHGSIHGTGWAGPRERPPESGQAPDPADGAVLAPESCTAGDGGTHRMSGICEGRVVIVTGGGRGIGREHALEFARQGAKVVVNDLGAEVDGTGGSLGPAGEVVDAIRAMGGEAVANGDDVSDFDAAGRLIQAAIDRFGRLDVLVNNAGILRDRMLVNMTPEEWDAVIRVHLRGSLRHQPPRRRLLAGSVQSGPGQRRPHHQHLVPFGGLREPRADQLRGRQGRDRGVHDHRRDGARPLRRDRERHLAIGPHPHDGEPAYG